jgi:hypothetical protein
MPDSTAAADFKMHVLRAFDAASREAEKRDERIRILEEKHAAAAGARQVEASPTSILLRVVALETSKIDPDRIRELEDKVTRLIVRSGMIGAAAGVVATIVGQIVIRLFFARVGG